MPIMKSEMVSQSQLDLRRSVFVIVKRAPLHFQTPQQLPTLITGGAAGLVVEVALYAKATLVASAISEDELSYANRYPDGAVLTSPDGRQLNVKLVGHETNAARLTQAYFFPQVLWPATHDLWSHRDEPEFDSALIDSWNAYQLFLDEWVRELSNMAKHFIKPTFLLHDYQFIGLPAGLRKLFPESTISLFDHCAWAGPDSFRPLPRHITVELLNSLSNVDWLGMYSPRWITNLLRCLDEYIPDIEINWKTHSVNHQGHVTNTGVVKLGYSPSAIEALDTRLPPEIEAWVGDSNLVVIYGRTDPNKNIVRELQAFLLAASELQGAKPKLLLRLSPHNQHVPMMRECYSQIIDMVANIRAKLGETTVMVVEENNMAQTLGSYRRADVLLFAPIIDGQNLSPFEAIMVNERNAGVIVSEMAGASENLHEVAHVVNPYDVRQMADAIIAILTSSDNERSNMAIKQKDVVSPLTTENWIKQQLSNVGLRRA